MKRHPSLADLSRDHHHALVLARKSLQAADGSDQEVNDAWETVCSDFAIDLQPHFDVEERLLLPALSKNTVNSAS